MSIEIILKKQLEEMAKSKDREEFYKVVPVFTQTLSHVRREHRTFTKYYLEYRKIEYWKKFNDYKPFEVEE